MSSDVSAKIIRRPDFYFVAIALCMSLFLLGLLLQSVLPSRAPMLEAMLGLGALGCMCFVWYITGVAVQGKLELRGNELRTSMRFRQDRVFDLRSAQVTLEQWVGPGAVRNQPVGPMLVFAQGEQHFRIGCYDYEGARLLTPAKVGAWFAREAHGATKCREF